MPGDKNNPVDGKIIVVCGDKQAEGTLAGLTIKGVKELIARDVSELALPPNAVAKITTMDPEDAAWKAVASPEEPIMMMLPTNWGVQMFQAVAKVVPDDYVVRKADIGLTFTDPPQKP